MVNHRLRWALSGSLLALSLLSMASPGRKVPQMSIGHTTVLHNAVTGKPVNAIVTDTRKVWPQITPVYNRPVP